jgi:hypothetical protein
VQKNKEMKDCFFFSGNGLGMRVIGGKEIPGSGGQLGAYVTRIYPGGVVESLGEIKEGTDSKPIL